MSDAYKNAVGGSLKLKGPALKEISKDKKKKKKDKKKEKDRERPDHEEKVVGAEAPKLPEHDFEAGLTAAERRYLQVQREREAERIKKAASKSHRERLEEMNKKLSALPEHHDIPKISWTG